MFVRSASEAVEAATVLRLCVGENAPRGLIDFLTGGPRSSG
jgi:hypothetical protein